MVAEPAGHVLDRDLRHQVQVEFRPDPGQRPGEQLGAVIRRALHQVSRSAAVYEPGERSRVVAGPVSEPAAGHARLQPGVQPSGHERVVETGHHHDLVHERVIRAAPSPQFLPQRALLLVGHILDDENLEIRTVRPGLRRRTGLVIVCVVPGAWVPALAVEVGLGDKGLVGLGHQRGEPIILIGGEQPPSLPVGLCPGKRPESLDRPEDVKQLGYRLDQLLDGTLLRLGAGELNGRLLQAGPGIIPELPQAVVRLQVRASRHGHHLRDLPLAAQSCAASRFKATIHRPADDPRFMALLLRELVYGAKRLPRSLPRAISARGSAPDAMYATPVACDSRSGVVMDVSGGSDANLHAGGWRNFRRTSGQASGVPGRPSCPGPGRPALRWLVVAAHRGHRKRLTPHLTRTGLLSSRPITRTISRARAMMPAVKDLFTLSSQPAIRRQPGGSVIPSAG